MSKILKWIFLGLWFIDVIVFLFGQKYAPENYHLIPGNPWGSLFGSTFISGVIFFCLAIFFAITSSKKEKNIKAKIKLEKPQTKYNTSFKRIVSRLFLTGIIGIIFGIAMFPFMTVADGLLFEQRAAIGGQNMIKMVALWGIFTLIVSLFTFWKKHFRMISVFLICCWIISIIFLVWVSTKDNNRPRCNRASPYPTPSEFTRSLDLIAQRMGIDEEKANGTLLQSAYNYRNCLNIQYSENDDKEVEAYFELPSNNDTKNLQELKIKVNPYYKNFDDLTLATLLAHEITHAGQYINDTLFKENKKINCFEKEAQAFTSQHSFILALNDEEQRSIYLRLNENSDINPTFQIIILTSQRGNEAAKACQDLQKKNKLSDELTNKCSWEGLESKLLQDIKENSYYQKQCAID